MISGTFVGQVVLVTGAASGIGAATAHAFAAAGASVALLDKDEAKATSLMNTLAAQGWEVSCWGVDVTDEAAVESTVTDVVNRYGRLDHAVLCAGVLYSALIVEMPLAVWRESLDVNLTGSFLVARKVAQAMLAHRTSGTITFISSQAGKRGGAYGGAYCASKFGVLGLMESLAREVTAQGIRVNAVCPGDVETPMTLQNLREKARILGISEDEYLQRMLKSIPIGHLAQPEEIAEVCLFLASPSASYISGESINVDGGQLSG